MPTVKIDDFTAAVMAELRKYEGASEDIIIDAAKTAGKAAAAELRQTSPQDKGDYARAWTHGKKDSRKGKSYTHAVYVKAPHYRLTHLLMNGHIIKNQYGKYAGRWGTGETRGNTFVHVAERNAIEDFENRVIKGVKEVGK